MNLYGDTRRALLDTLASWYADGPPVLWLHGLSGVGKNAVARALAERVDNDPITWVDMPDGGADAGVDDLLLNLTTALADQGDMRLDDALEGGEKAVSTALLTVLREPRLMIWDEAQTLLDAHGRPTKTVEALLRRIGRVGEGRVLLLTHTRPGEGKWREPHRFEELPPLGVNDGRALLDDLLAEQHLEDAIQPGLRADVVRWLGGHPRALQLLVGALHDAALEDLIELAPALWDTREASVDPELLAAFEAEVVAHVVDPLPEYACRSLRRASFFRRPLDRHAIEAVAHGEPDKGESRRLLSNRYLLDFERERNRYAVNPVAQLVMRDRADDAERLDAHRIAGDHYARHFKAKRLSGHGERQVLDFVEARHHLLAAGREVELRKISGRFFAYIQRTVSWQSPVPKTAETLSARIELLLALIPNAPGAPPELAYHLARCLDRRGRPDDRARALPYARRATHQNLWEEMWQLRLRLEGTADLDRALKDARRILPKIDSAAGVQTLYGLLGAMLSKANRHTEALSLLKEGIERVEPQHNLFSLYQEAGRILAETGQPDEAVTLLRAGIERLEPQHNLFSLYQLLVAILASSGRVTDALDAAEEGLRRLPLRRFNRYKLAESAVLLAAAAGESERLRAWAAATDMRRLNDGQRALAEAFIAQLEDDWRTAAEVAETGWRAAPYYRLLGSMVALARLGAGDLSAARAAIEAVGPRDGEPSLWLAALIEYAADDAHAARRWWARYLGVELNAAPVPTREALLAVWGGPIGLNDTHVAYTFPLLPPTATGLPNTVRRAPGEPAPSLERQDDDPGRGWLAVATEWASRRGGISTFNRTLCTALADAGERVVCLVPDATTEEVAEANRAGVELITALREAGADDAARLRRRPTLPDGFTPTVVIGHGRITGPAARVLVDDYFTGARRLHLLHMAPDEIEWHKPGRDDDAATRAEERNQQEIELGRSSHRAVAIGPRLYNHFARRLRHKIVRLDPGIGTPRLVDGPPPGEPHIVLAFGRMEDPQIKRPDLAARAAAHARQHGHRLELYVRGAPAGTGGDERTRLLEQAGDPGLPVTVRSYTVDAERLADDLQCASVMLMPSRTEGFGLVGLETIAAGVPVRISDQSGLGELLTKLLGDAAARHVVAVTQDDDKDVAAWGRALDHVLSDREAAFRHAAELREMLVENLTWANAVAELIAAVEAE